MNIEKEMEKEVRDEETRKMYVAAILTGTLASGNFNIISSLDRRYIMEYANKLADEMMIYGDN